MINKIKYVLKAVKLFFLTGYYTWKYRKTRIQENKAINDAKIECDNLSLKNNKKMFLMLIGGQMLIGNRDNLKAMAKDMRLTIQQVKKYVIYETK